MAARRRRQQDLLLPRNRVTRDLSWQTSIFGHPNPDVVKQWEKVGAQVLRTGNSGTITFSTNGNDLSLETFVKKK